MTLVIPTQGALVAADSAVTLARYSKLISMPECAFWGVFNESDVTGDCREIWTKMQRDTIAKYLAEAQEELELEVGYFLSPRYVVGALSEQPLGLDRYVDDQVYGRPMNTRWPKIIAVGVRAESDISLGEPVSYLPDPMTATVGPLAAPTLASADELAIFHPGTDVEINPSSVSLVGGQLTVTFPRCRMVNAASADNPSNGLDVTDDNLFEVEVDLKRVYTDPSVGANLVIPHTCGAQCLAQSCTEYTRPACIYLEDARLGHVNVRSATYTNGAWVANRRGCCPHPTRARLHYLAGMATLTRQAEDAVVRLAHSKMPTEPCGCQVSQFMWKRDRTVPDILTRERINCRFGQNDGAWAAWEFAQAMKQVRGSIL